MYKMAGPAHIAKLLGIHPQTVLHQLLDAGIASAALPVLALDNTPDDGQPHYVCNPDAPGCLPSTISDANLNTSVASIINQFENHSCSMVIGQLCAANILDVSRERTAQAIQHATGATAHFGRQEIHHREYRVAGLNLLWHHDGQHGLIHWKIVIHAFIDGYSRFVHLGVDVVKGFVAKWSNFFLALEHEHRLDCNDQFHIWLLHHLFLLCIKFDAMTWADGWNNHTFSRLPNHPCRQHLPTPRELYYIGVHQHGVRSLEVVDTDELPQHDIAEYSIAWEEHEDDSMMRIHWEHAANQVELDDADRHPNGYGLPRRLVEVCVPEPPVPIAPDEIRSLDQHLALHVDMDSTSMNV
ncbi:hypothetical protein EXIGLDRAFT_694455 [Exidia glandulosa HHB12029]|uniref:Integrase core domain-containing protein n=1 Tax=Exidia glandulosa HHB12029 TaxID=1314781 RepID=A0A165GL14_EXIGL|nr:hypothetical protein EXIGLDRAFT_694455 [Exidia glandulosa HHB12029]